MSEKDLYDVLVIGGGFAGLTAVRELSGQGLKIALLEARDRLGGRAWFKEWNGQQIEYGGGWVYWTQPHVWAEITRYQLDLFERPGWPKSSDDPMRVLVGDEVVTNTLKENMAQLFPLVDSFADMAHALFPQPFNPHINMAQIEKYDHLSSIDRANEFDLTPFQRVALNRLLSLQCHNHPKNGAYVEFLRWYALSHFNMENYLSTASRFQFKDGTRALVDAMWQDCEADLFLNTAVTAVEQSKEKVKVFEKNGREFSARYVLVAVPINVLQSILFTPNLNQGKLSLSNQRHSGAGHKIYVRVAGYWPKFNCAADADAPITTIFVQEAKQDETLLVLFTVNDKLMTLTNQSIQSALRQFAPNIEVLDHTAHDWVSDPYALGTWCSYRPNQTSQYLAQAQAPEGRLFFAGADIANGWRGFFDGAIESGFRASKDVKLKLGQS